MLTVNRFTKPPLEDVQQLVSEIRLSHEGTAESDQIPAPF